MTPERAPDEGAVARVRELRTEGRLGRALRVVDSLIAEHGQTADLLAARAVVLTSRGWLVDALAVADLAVDRWPDSAASRAARADVLYEMDRNGEALAEVERATRLDPSDAYAHSIRATVLSELGRGVEAIDSARRAMALAPEDPEPLGALLAALVAAGRGQQALAQADAAVRDRRTAWTLALRSLVRMLLEDHAGSAADGRAAAELDPDNMITALMAAQADASEERWYEVLHRLDTEEARPQLAAALLRATAYAQSGRPADAAREAQAVLAQQPANTGALAQLGLAQMRLERWSEAMHTYTRILALDPEDATAVEARARVWCELGRPDAAIADLDRLIAGQPGEVAGYAIRSLAHMLAGRHKQALADAEAALARGDSPDGLAGQARMIALMYGGRRREAEQLARERLRRRPDDEFAQVFVKAANDRDEQMIDSLVSLAFRIFGLLS